MSAALDLMSGPRLAPVLEQSADRQICLLDQPDRLTPWLALPEPVLGQAAQLDLSLRPVEPRGEVDHQTWRLDQFDSAYDTPAQLSIWMLRKRPQERFSQARRLAFWELGRELMGLETHISWRAPWLVAFWLPRDCRLQGLWLLELDLHASALAHQ